MPYTNSYVLKEKMNDSLIQDSIENFRTSLINSFDSVVHAFEVYEIEANSRENDYPSSFEDFFNDWAECNWELLVERVICDPLERIYEYGGGTDYDPSQYSHVFFQNSQITHEIICVPLTTAIDSITNLEIDINKFQFDSFVSLSNGWFEIEPPFDFVLMQEVNAYGANYQQIILPVKSVVFKANKLSKNITR